MFIVFGMLIFIMCISAKITPIGVNEDYLSMDNTLAIKGIFVVLIFLSHIRTYTAFDFVLDTTVIRIIDLMSQLVVTMFLFYSGYGIYMNLLKRKIIISKTFRDIVLLMCL